MEESGRLHTVHGVAKNRIRLSDFTFFLSSIIASGYELGGQKHKVWAFKELGVDIPPKPSQR